MPVARGTCLGPYEIDRLPGTGSTGEVYRARDTVCRPAANGSLCWFEDLRRRAPATGQ